MGRPRKANYNYSDGINIDSHQSTDCYFIAKMSSDEEGKPRLTLNLKSIRELMSKESKKITAVFIEEHKELKSEILSAIGQIIDDKLSVFDEKISNLEGIVKSNDQVMHKLRSDIEILTRVTEDQKAEIDALDSKLNALHAKSLNHDKSVQSLNSYQELFKSNAKALEERLENRTNRQLRKTLVISGIDEEENESWSATRRILAQTISDNLPKCSFMDAEDMFERVHRSGPTKNASKKRA